MAGAVDLPAIEARLQQILDPYRGRLETASIYGIPALRRPGAKAHDWFAFVKPASRHVGFYLMPIYTWPELVESLSPGLRKRLTGKSVFTFPALDESLATELEGLVARAYAAYMGERPGPAVPE
jgi:hypothetical protein